MEIVQTELRLTQSRIRCLYLMYDLSEGATVNAQQFLLSIYSELQSSNQKALNAPMEISGISLHLSGEKIVQLGFVLVDLFFSGIPNLTADSSPKLGMHFIQNDNGSIDIKISSNWLHLNELSEITRIFIAQLGAKIVDANSENELVLSLTDIEM